MYAKAYSGINMLYPAINAKIGPTDAAAQVRSNHIYYILFYILAAMRLDQ